MGILCAIVGIVSSILVLVYRPEPLVFAGYYLAGMVYSTQAAFFAWGISIPLSLSLSIYIDFLHTLSRASWTDPPRPANVVCRNDNEERVIVLASMNMFSSAVNAWWSIVFYSANFGPRFRRGMWAMIGVSIALFVWTITIRWMQRREESRPPSVVGYDDEEVVVEKGLPAARAGET